MNIDIEKLVKICKEHNRDMPTEMKLIYDVKSKSLKADYRYDLVYSNDPVKTASNIGDDWFEEVKKENTDLCELVGKRDKEIEKLEAQLKQARNDYNSLKMAKMIEISDGDMENAQKRISKLIRDVNKCITLISEK